MVHASAHIAFSLFVWSTVTKQFQGSRAVYILFAKLISAEYTLLVCWAGSKCIYPLCLCRAITLPPLRYNKDIRTKARLTAVHATAVEIGHWFIRLNCFGVSFICHGDHFDQNRRPHWRKAAVRVSDVVRAWRAHNSIFQEEIAGLPAFAQTLENVLSAYCVQQEKKSWAH